jgi:hypothetical protein
MSIATFTLLFFFSFLLPAERFLAPFAQLHPGESLALIRGESVSNALGE